MDFSHPIETSTFLVDNGSLQPEAVIRLRETARRLSERVGAHVEPVSLLHSSAIGADKLGGVSAEILEPAIRRRCRAGVSEIRILPLFFGPSGALTEYLPERIARIAAEFPGLRVTMARPIVDVAESDNRLARALAARVLESAAIGPTERPRVILVDHGSPRREVAAVRDHVSRQLTSVLGSAVKSVRAASMERRPGDEYAFNEPLLERALLEALHDDPSGPVIVSLMFFSPGRHAGPGGDIEEICRRCERSASGFRIQMTGVLGDHPLLIDILADRHRELCERSKDGAQSDG